MSQTSIPSALTIAFAGMLADMCEHDIRTAVSVESSAEIPFGVMVAHDTTSDGAKLPAASTAKCMGVVTHSHAYDKPNELGTTGLKPKAVLNVLTRGRAWVTVEETVAVGDRGYIRYAAGAGGTQLGGFRKSAVTNETIDVTKNVKFLTAASAAGLALAEFDMMNA
jgi:hypothetical protein